VQTLQQLRVFALLICLYMRSCFGPEGAPQVTACWHLSLVCKHVALTLDPSIPCAHHEARCTTLPPAVSNRCWNVIPLKYR
jgi:hypothetical protein